MMVFDLGCCDYIESLPRLARPSPCLKPGNGYDAFRACAHLNFFALERLST